MQNAGYNTCETTTMLVRKHYKKTFRKPNYMRKHMNTSARGRFIEFILYGITYN